MLNMWVRCGISIVLLWTDSAVIRTAQGSPAVGPHIEVSGCGNVSCPEIGDADLKFALWIFNQ